MWSYVNFWPGLKIGLNIARQPTVRKAQTSCELRGVESGFWSWRLAIRWGMGLFQNDHRFPANRFFSFRLYFFFDVLGKTWRHVF
jgi:hypothetical protein